MSFWGCRSGCGGAVGGGRRRPGGFSERKERPARGVRGKEKQKHFGRQRGGPGGSWETKSFFLWKSDRRLFFSGDAQASAQHAGNPGDKLKE